jgi:hypothetical protein
LHIHFPFGCGFITNNDWIIVAMSLFGGQRMKFSLVSFGSGVGALQRGLDVTLKFGFLPGAEVGL